MALQPRHHGAWPAHRNRAPGRPRNDPCALGSHALGLAIAVFGGRTNRRVGHALLRHHTPQPADRGVLGAHADLGLWRLYPQSFGVGISGTSCRTDHRCRARSLGVEWVGSSRRPRLCLVGRGGRRFRSVRQLGAARIGHGQRTVRRGLRRAASWRATGRLSTRGDFAHLVRRVCQHGVLATHQLAG